MKKLFLLVVLFVLSLSVNTQTADAKPFKIGTGALIGLSIGDMAYFDAASLAYGIDLISKG